MYREYGRQKNKRGGKENTGEKRDDREEEDSQEGRGIKELVYTAIQTYLLLRHTGVSAFPSYPGLIGSLATAQDAAFHQESFFH